MGGGGRSRLLSCHFSSHLETNILSLLCADYFTVVNTLALAYTFPKCSRGAVVPLNVLGFSSVHGWWTGFEGRRKCAQIFIISIISKRHQTSAHQEQKLCYGHFSSISSRGTSRQSHTLKSTLCIQIIITCTENTVGSGAA